MTAIPPAGREMSRENPIEWLRWYVSAEHWEPLGLKDDYRIFGGLMLSDLRCALAAHDALVAAAKPIIDTARSSKLGRADYVCMISLDLIEALRQASENPQ